MPDDYDPSADALGSWEVATTALRERTANETLAAFVGEIEHQLDEHKIIDEALRQIYRRAKTAGLVPAFLRMMVKERQMEPEERSARYRTLDEYRDALGLFADTPLGEAAIAAAGKPKPFAEQTVHAPRRKRRGPVIFDQENPQGAA